MAKKKTIKNVSPVVESNEVAERIDDTYETKLRTTTTFNRHAIVETEVTMKKPDNLAANYVADVAKVYVNGEEINNGDDPTGTIEITENGTVDVKDYAEASVNVPSYPEPTGTITITENGTTDVKNYAEADVQVQTLKLKIAVTNQTSDSNFKLLDTETGLWTSTSYSLANVEQAITNNLPVVVYETTVYSNVAGSVIDSKLEEIATRTGTTRQTINISVAPWYASGNFYRYEFPQGQTTLIPVKDYLLMILRVKNA